MVELSSAGIQATVNIILAGNELSLFLCMLFENTRRQMDFIVHLWSECLVVTLTCVMILISETVGFIPERFSLINYSFPPLRCKIQSAEIYAAIGYLTNGYSGIIRLCRLASEVIQSSRG